MRTQLYDKLISVARQQPPDDRVPYAFEKRVMAHLEHPPRQDVFAAWSRALWRAAASCVVLVSLFAAWSFANPPAPGVSDLSQDFESTVFAALEQEQPVDSW